MVLHQEGFVKPGEKIRFLPKQQGVVHSVTALWQNASVGCQKPENFFSAPKHVIPPPLFMT
jgi:hypothetical protein